MSSRRSYGLGLLVLLVILLLGLSQFLLFLQPLATPRLSITHTAFTQENSFQVSYELTPWKYPIPLEAVAIPLESAPVEPGIYVVYTGNYAAYDVLHWLRYSLSAMQWQGSISLVNESQLSGLIRGGFQGALVLVPGSNNVSTGDLQELATFTRAGGTLFWIDSVPFGGSDIVEEQLLGIDIRTTSYANPVCKPQIQSTVSGALNLDFNATTGRIVSQSVVGLGGLILGPILQCGDVGLTSIAAIPVGNGTFVPFGGGEGILGTGSDIVTLTTDISRILATHILTDLPIRLQDVTSLVPGNYEGNWTVGPSGPETRMVLVNGSEAVRWSKGSAWLAFSLKNSLAISPNDFLSISYSLESITNGLPYLQLTDDRGNLVQYYLPLLPSNGTASITVNVNSTSLEQGGPMDYNSIRSVSLVFGNNLPNPSVGNMSMVLTGLKVERCDTVLSSIAEENFLSSNALTVNTFSFNATEKIEYVDVIVYSSDYSFPFFTHALVRVELA